MTDIIADCFLRFLPAVCVISEMKTSGMQVKGNIEWFYVGMSGAINYVARYTRFLESENFTSKSILYKKNVIPKADAYSIQKDS